jgi:hypothetical protein
VCCHLRYNLKSQTYRSWVGVLVTRLEGRGRSDIGQRVLSFTYAG